MSCAGEVTVLHHITVQGYLLTPRYILLLKITGSTTLCFRLLQVKHYTRVSLFFLSLFEEYSALKHREKTLM